MLKSLSIAMLVEAVRVETQVVYTSMLSKRVFQILLASNTSLMTHLVSISLAAKLLRDARTAPGHHALLGRPARINAGLLITKTTM